MIKKYVFNLLLILAGSFVSAIGLYIFVYPAGFAPSGIDGIATMLQEKFPMVNGGIFLFALNAPLLVLSIIFLDKKFTVYTIISIVSLSAFLVLMEVLDDQGYINQYVSNEKLLPAIFSGLMLGIRTGLVFKIGGSSGGVDIVAAIIQKKNPYVNLERYVTVLCYVIIGASYFVYWHLESIMLSIIQMFVFEMTVSFIMRSKRNAVEFKIVTSEPDALREDILSILKHGATIVDSKGMFTGDNKSMIFCVVNIRQVPEFMKLLKKYDNLFVYSSAVSSVNGNFRWNKDDIVK
ncbi:MAG: YitT family protein [Clostridiales bacterium]|nr:YitT family protein [Clostridiales bacterium]